MSGSCWVPELLWRTKQIYSHGTHSPMEEGDINQVITHVYNYKLGHEPRGKVQGAMSKCNRGTDLFQRGGGLGESIPNKAPFNADLYRELKGERLLAICLPSLCSVSSPGV